MQITFDIPDTASSYLDEVVTRYNTNNGTTYTKEQFSAQTIKRLMRDEKLRQFHEDERVKIEDATNKVSADATKRINTEVTRLENIIDMDSN